MQPSVAHVYTGFVVVVVLDFSIHGTDDNGIHETKWVPEILCAICITYMTLNLKEVFYSRIIYLPTHTRTMYYVLKKQIDRVYLKSLK